MSLEQFEKYDLTNQFNSKLKSISANPFEDIPPKEDALSELKELQNKLIDLQEKFYVDRRKKFLIVLQGMDTSGKNGTIKDVFKGVNPQYIHVASFTKPNSLELNHDFLWRVHKRVPSKGEIVIFDRSHYEDVLAVRVNELVSKEVWERRFDHINNFEQLLVDEGTIILKFFLHIDRNTQRLRLAKRLNNPLKNWKFDESDLIARKKWDKYEEAYQEVFRKTSKKDSPWYIIPANVKWARNLLVARIITATIKDLEFTYPKPDFIPSEIEIPK